jgi:hypothetical protein
MAKFVSLVEPVLPGMSDAVAASALDVGDGSGPRDLAEVIAKATTASRTQGGQQ